ncbi:16195_t:CDS:1 [Gigaspora margarita]|uniref:16195_t:CDS:1 n=1 Tax=Gigaspora margarita TaxID=4874 RepID=A0ABM8W2J6_GIGMA|nr:16195_t:CDS:1 [Gigaspora margarita]
MSINLLSNEILQEIVKNLRQNDMFSCLLVSREWCKNTVSLLWQDPQLVRGKCNKYRVLARTYMLCFTREEKKYLKNNGVPIPPAPHRRPPTFDYPFFLRKIRIGFIERLAFEWIYRKRSVDRKGVILHLNKALQELLFSRAQRLESICFDSEWHFAGRQFPSWQNLKILEVSASSYNSLNPSSFLQTIVNSSCNHIKIIHSDIDRKHKDCDNLLSRLITNQRSLEEIKLGSYFQVPQSINTLKCLKFNNVDFSAFSGEFAKNSLETIELLEIRSCQLKTEHFLNSVLKMNNLRQFTFNDHRLNDPSIHNFFIKLLKTINNLKYLSIHFEYKDQQTYSLVEAIAPLCLQLEYLKLPSFDLKELLPYMKFFDQLKYFRIDLDIRLNSTLFLQTAKELPSTLQHLIINDQKYLINQRYRKIRRNYVSLGVEVYKKFFSTINCKGLKSIYICSDFLPSELQNLNFKWHNKEMPEKI